MRLQTKNKEAVCLLPPCSGQKTQEDLVHILAHCGYLDDTRAGLLRFTTKFSQDLEPLNIILNEFANPRHPLFTQFMVDCSCLPQVILAVQLHGEIILHHLFRITRTWCYSLHRERLKQLGRWHHQCPFYHDTFYEAKLVMCLLLGQCWKIVIGCSLSF